MICDELKPHDDHETTEGRCSGRAAHGRLDSTQVFRSSARHRVGTCTACRTALFSDVELEVTVSPPTISDDATVKLYANARPVAMRLTHDCDRDRDRETSERMS